MTQPQPTPATTERLVAGVDLLTESERDADSMLHQAVHRLVELGAADGALLATHWARADDVPHVAMSLEIPGANDAEALWGLLTDALPGQHWDQHAGRCVGRRRAGPLALQQAAASAADAHLAGASGRAVQFPGVERLTGSVTVRDILRDSAITSVRVLAQGPASPDSVVVTRDFVRPRWSAGQLVLDVQPAAGGTLVPFEVPNPTPCCASGHEGPISHRAAAAGC